MSTPWEKQGGEKLWRKGRGREWVSDGLTPRQQLRPSSQQEHTQCFRQSTTLHKSLYSCFLKKCETTSTSGRKKIKYVEKLGVGEKCGETEGGRKCVEKLRNREKMCGETGVVEKMRRNWGGRKDAEKLRNREKRCQNIVIPCNNTTQLL